MATLDFYASWALNRIETDKFRRRFCLDHQEVGARYFARKIESGKHRVVSSAG